MTKEPRPKLGSALREGRKNWTESDLPFSAKLRMLLRNEWKKVSTLQACCGDYGAPGC